MFWDVLSFGKVSYGKIREISSNRNVIYFRASFWHILLDA